MTKKAAFYLMLSAVFFSGAQAQENQPSEEVVVIVEEEERPDMPILFFTKEQRRILEAVRQGVVASDTFEAEGFIPLVVIEETLPEESQFVEPVRKERSGFSVDALVRNRKTGKDYFWIGGRIVDVEKDADLLGEDGFIIGEDDVNADNAIQGIDEYEGTRFEVKVGQSVTKDGYIDEGLPVVVVRRHKN